jgi:hypothetical protein
VSASDVIARLRELHKRVEAMDLAKLDEEAALLNALPALLECASVLAEIIGPDNKAHYDTAEERKARAALQALAEGGGE